MHRLMELPRKAAHSGLCASSSDSMAANTRLSVDLELRIGRLEASQLVPNILPGA